MNQNSTEAINDTSTKASPPFFCLDVPDKPRNDSNEDILSLGLVTVGMLSSPTIILLNAIVIIVFKQRKELKKNSHLLLSSLAVADLLIGAIFIPAWVIIALVIIGQVSVKRVCTLLVINSKLMACLLFSSLHHLTAIAWERYVAIRKWADYKIIVTKTRLKRLAIVAWLAAIVITFPVLIMELMGIDSKVLKTWIIVGNVCGATSFLLIVYLYIMVCLGIRKRKTSDFGQVKALVQAKLQSKVTKTTGLITAALFFTIILASVLFSLRIIFPAFRTISIFQIEGILFQLNSVINPLVYFYRDRLFRKAVLELLRMMNPDPVHLSNRTEILHGGQDRFRSKADDVQRQMKNDENRRRSRQRRPVSCNLLVGRNHEMMLKRSSSAPALVNISANVLAGLQMQNPSASVIITTAAFHAERGVRYQARENHDSPGEAMNKPL